MTAPVQPSLRTQIAALNATPLSQNAIALMRQAKVEMWEGKLAVLVLLEWALENLAADPHWAEAVDNAANLAAANDPKAAYSKLAAPRIEQATTLEAAGLAILGWVVDLIPPGSAPA